jgi:hypothetical protein
MCIRLDVVLQVGTIGEMVIVDSASSSQPFQETLDVYPLNEN